ncbi:MAG: anti-sigma factor [Gammaproteobacteria bacterium]
MMKCNDLQQRLDDYLDGELDPLLVTMLEQHIVSCDSCNTTVKQAQRLLPELKQFSTNFGNIPDSKFIASAFQKVRTQYPEGKTNNSWLKVNVKTGFATAIAAGFTVWVVLATFILPALNSDTVVTNLAVINQTSENISTLNIGVDEIRVIRLAINTQDEFDKVTLSVILPKHVVLDGHKDKHKLIWDTRLAKGNNILRIPLKATGYGQGNFIAQITHNGKVKTFRVFLKSQKPDLSDIHITEIQV